MFAHIVAADVAEKFAPKDAGRMPHVSAIFVVDGKAETFVM
jgi:hypothetical protein